MERLTCNKLKTICDGYFVNLASKEEATKYRMLVESAPKYEELYKRLAEYEDAEEQGLLVKFPYPFGTKLYYVIDDWDYGMSVKEIIFDLEFISDVLKYPNEYYLTKEEAEQALKQMEE